jgi:hypothetical protein
VSLLLLRALPLALSDDFALPPRLFDVDFLHILEVSPNNPDLRLLRVVRCKPPCWNQVTTTISTHVNGFSPKLQS